MELELRKTSSKLSNYFSTFISFDFCLQGKLAERVCPALRNAAEIAFWHFYFSKLNSKLAKQK